MRPAYLIIPLRSSAKGFASYKTGPIAKNEPHGHDGWMDSSTISTDAATAAAERAEIAVTRVNVADRLTEIARLMPQSVAIAEVIGGRRGTRNGKRQYKAVSFEWLD